MTSPRAVLSCVLSLTVVTAASGQGVFVEPDVTVLHTFQPGAPSFGWAASELTDISSPPDGVMELIVSANATRQIFVYSGATGALIHHIPAPPADPVSGTFGHAIADAGDVDGDSIHDIIVGSPASPASANPGRAYVFSGADASLIWTFVGEAAGNRFGSAVGGAGDVNSDGRADLLVTAANNAAAGIGAGRGYIFSGVDGSLIRHLEPEAAGDAFGSGAAGTGDLNGDGIGDQIVGAPGAGTAGKAYVFSGADGSLLFATISPFGGGAYGTFFVAGVGDVNNDGNRDVYVGDFAANSGRGRAHVYSGIDGATLHVFNGNPGDGMGCGRGAGDVDGDGHADLCIGHYTNSTGATQAGRLTIWSGRTGALLRTITSATAGENLGFDAIGVGDTNGDGFIDFLGAASPHSRAYLIAGIDLSCQIPSPATADPSGIRPSRYIAIQPGNAGVMTAIRVKLTSMHHPDPPNSPSSPAPDMRALEDQVRWVGAPATCPDSANQGTTFKCATLQCAPVYRDWGADLSGSLLYVTGTAIVPSSIYDIQVVHQACDPNSEDSFSTAVVVSTGRWGDIVADFQLPSPAPLTQPNVLDISAEVDKLKDLPLAIIKPRAQLQPAAINPMAATTVVEISSAVDAVKGFPYPFAVQACP